MRHTKGELVWTGTNSNQQTLPLNANGARYTIDRFGGAWVISFLPNGTPDKGPRERVEWLPGRRSMTTAKLAVAAHHAQQEVQT
jgi:hypothetical protein